MMKFKWTSYNISRLKFLITLLIIGIIIGFIIYYRQDDLIKASITHEMTNLKEIISSTRQNNFLYHFLLLAALLIFSLIVVGLPIILFYFFYEGISLGFLLAGFFHYQGWQGLLFGLVFTLINKLIFYLGLVYLVLVSIRYAQKMIVALKNKDLRINEYLVNHLIKILFGTGIILIYDVFLYFWGNKLLTHFLFLF